MTIPDFRTVRELAREQIINHAKNLAQDTETVFESVIEKDVCIPLSESEQEALSDAVLAEIGRAQIIVLWPDGRPQCTSHAHPDFIEDPTIRCELPDGHAWHRNGERTWTP